MDFRKEMEEILDLVEEAKNRLGRLGMEMDEGDLDTASIDEAMDALDDVIDILEDAAGEE